jgi:AcrR family transcriptional regulator
MFAARRAAMARRPASQRHGAYYDVVAPIRSGEKELYAQSSAAAVAGFRHPDDGCNGAPTDSAVSRWPAKEAMHERILATADRLFNGEGIRAVGVDKIAAEIGISKRTLYNYYPSKDELVFAYLSRRYVPVRSSERPPAEQILDLFDWLERWFASDGFRGCPFVNAVAEMGDPAARIAIEFKEQRRVWMRGLLEQINVPDPDALATHLAILVEGAIASALVGGDPKIARSAKQAARVLLDAAVGSGSSADAIL